MAYLNLKKAAISQAIKWEGFFQGVSLLKKIFLVAFLLNFFLFVIFQLSEAMGFFFIFLSLFLACKILEAFFQSKLKKPLLKIETEKELPIPEDFNLAEILEFEVAKAINKSLSFARSRRLEINSTILFYFLLKDNPKLRFIFSRALLDFNQVKRILKGQMEREPEKNLEEIISGSIAIAREEGHSTIKISDFLTFLSKEDPVFKSILIEAKLSAEDIENLARLQEIFEEKAKRRKGFWKMENLTKMGSIGRDWAAGYTVTLDRFSVDWTKVIKKRGYEEIIGHKKEIERLERVLAREGLNNILLVGEPGVGRKSIIHAMAKKIIFGQSLPSLNYKRMVELDLSALLAQVENQRMTESLLEIVFSEAITAGNIILIIDEFPNFVAGRKRPGAVDISGILLKYLKFPQFQIIGICSSSGFHKYVEQNPAVSAFFEKVEVSEISEKETLLVLETLIPFYERKYKKFISYPVLRDIVTYSAKYLPAVPFPKKAIDLLDETMVYVSRYVKGKTILPEHVARIVTEKTKIPVGEIETKEKEILLNLEDLIHKRIINQNEAVNEISEAMRRARAEITIRKGPIGAFLFLGPTGVGKTETSKALTEIYFGSEERMIRLDMSEFQDIKDIPRLIGAPEKEGLLTTKIKERPFSLILLDEIEKAHSDILNLFLQVLDEGHITDGVGRKVSFKNAIIIATSNAGYKIILEALKEETEWSQVKEKLLNYLFANAIFRPEFINRFDGVIVFRPLTKENLLDIAQLMLEKLKRNLTSKYIEFEINQALKEKIVELGYNPAFGAREMRRVIQNKVENALARALLEEKLKRGDKITMNENFEIIKLSD